MADHWRWSAGRYAAKLCHAWVAAIRDACWVIHISYFDASVDGARSFQCSRAPFRFLTMLSDSIIVACLVGVRVLHSAPKARRYHDQRSCRVEARTGRASCDRGVLGRRARGVGSRRSASFAQSQCLCSDCGSRPSQWLPRLRGRQGWRKSVHQDSCGTRSSPTTTAAGDRARDSERGCLP